MSASELKLTAHVIGNWLVIDMTGPVGAVTESILRSDEEIAIGDNEFMFDPILSLFCIDVVRTLFAVTEVSDTTVFAVKLPIRVALPIVVSPNTEAVITSVFTRVTSSLVLSNQL